MGINKKTLLIIIGIITIFIFTSITVSNIFLKEENKTKIIKQKNTIGIIVEGQEQDSFPSKQDYAFEKAVCNGVEVTASDTGIDSFNINISGISATSNCTFYFIHQEFEQLVNYTMLYDKGNEFTELTGGFEAHYYYAGTLNMVKNSNNISITKDTYLGGMLSSQKIDFTNYSSLYCLYDLLSLSTQHSGQSFVAAPNCATTTYPDTNYYVGDIDSRSLVAKSNILAHVKLNEFHHGYTGALLTNYNMHYGFYHEFGSVLVYNLFATKSDNWQELCSRAGITAPATLEELVIDATKLNAILSNQDAVNYMVKQCTGDFMASAINSETFMNALNNSPYKTTIESNTHWAKFLGMINN